MRTSLNSTVTEKTNLPAPKIMSAINPKEPDRTCTSTTRQTTKKVAPLHVTSPALSRRKLNARCEGFGVARGDSPTERHVVLYPKAIQNCIVFASYVQGDIGSTSGSRRAGTPDRWFRP